MTEAVKKGKTIIDYMSDEDYARYTELIAKAEEAKANAPKAPRAPRGPMTVEQKKKNTEAKIAKLKEKLNALLASEAGEEVVDAE